ncbi:MAG: hypothetical protein JKY02_03035 [Flavobacteriaceae bacterium]|nr:hypothetical protein [Flavobacteriaceae bacterium]
MHFVQKIILYIYLMGKKIIYVVLIVIGGILQLSSITGISGILKIAFSDNDSAFKIGYFITYIVFIILGIYLVRWGFRKLNPPKEKDSIDDIGHN